jgi:hypothetical protein
MRHAIYIDHINASVQVATCTIWCQQHGPRERELVLALLLERNGQAHRGSLW